MIQIIVLVSLVLILGFALQRIIENLKSSTTAKQSFRRGAFWLCVILGLALAATGRLGFIIPVIGALIAAVLRSLPALFPLVMQFLPVWKRWQLQQQALRQNAGDAQGNQGSTVESRYLRMHLDHASGRLSGEIIAGTYAGHWLNDLNQSQLRSFYSECVRGDQESATLMHAYMDKVYGEGWADSAAGSSGERDQRQNSGSGGSAAMTTAEAYEVLGLQQGASHEEILAAHRRLMQKMHPDRGGSDYLAAKINAAKSVLIG